MSEATMYQVYAGWIGQGDCTRSEAAEHFGVHKSTAQHHLDLGVVNGLLKRSWTWTHQNQVGWVYSSIDRELPLPFEDDAEGHDKHAPNECEQCGGTGYVNGYYERDAYPCPLCNKSELPIFEQSPLL